MAFNPFEDKSVNTEFNPFNKDELPIETRQDNTSGNGMPDMFSKFILSPEHPVTGHLIRGVGTAIKNVNDTVTEFGRPNYKSPEQWKAEQPWLSKAITNAGESIQKQHDDNFSKSYNPYTADWYAANLAEMAPTSVGLAVTGLAALRTSNNQLISEGAKQAARGLGAGAKTVQLAGQLAPAMSTGAVAALPEASMEGQQAFEEAYKEAQLNGMNPEEATDYATKVKNYVTAANMALLTGTNAVEIVAGLGKLPFKIPANAAARIAANASRIGIAGASEGIQEGTQQIIPKIAQGKEWSPFDEDVKQASALGVGAGLLFGGAGVGLRAMEGRNNNKAAPQSDFNSQLQSFKAAITDVESGGNYDAIGPEIGGDRARGKYQIMESNWPSWAEVAGLPADAPWTPENQERVADAKFREYYNQFGGDWGKVAIAWHAGPNRANLSEEQLTKLSDGNMSTLDYRNAIIGMMGNVSPGNGYMSQSNESTPAPTYTPEETQQAVKWLDDQRAMSSDANEINKFDEALSKGSISQLLNEHMVTDGERRVPLGQHLFPDKFKQQENTNQEQPASDIADSIRRMPEQRLWDLAIQYDGSSNPKYQEFQKLILAELSNREKPPDMSTAQAAVTNAQSAINSTAFEQPRPFITSAQREQGQGVVNALNNIAVQKFDQAEQKFRPLPNRTEPVKSSAAFSPPEMQQRLSQLAQPGVVPGAQFPPGQIILPESQNLQGQRAVQQLQQANSQRPAPLPTMQDIADQKLISSAVNRGDYTNAARLARETGQESRADLYEGVNSGRQSSPEEIRGLRRQLTQAVGARDYPRAWNLANQLGLDKQKGIYEREMAKQGIRFSRGRGENTSQEKIEKEPNNRRETGKFRSFSFGQEPVYGVTHEIPFGNGQTERFRFIPEKNWTKEEPAIAELGDFMGAPVRFIFSFNKNLRGWHDPVSGVTIINRNGNRGVEWAFWHENMHWMKEKDPALYRALLGDVQKAGAITQEQMGAYRQTIALGDQLSDIDVIEEMLADEFADNAKRRAWLQQLQQRNGNVFERLVEWFKSLISRLKYTVNAGENSRLTLEQVKAFENAARRTLLSMKDADGNRLFADRKEFPHVPLEARAGMQYSAESEGASFARQLDEWAAGSLHPRAMLTLGKTPDVLIKVGAKQLPIEISQKVVAKIVNTKGTDGGKHGLAMDVLKQLPENLDNPVMVFKSATTENAVVVLTEMVDQNGDNVIAAIHLERQHGRNVVNAMASVYGKENTANFAQKQIEAGRLLYPNKEKGRDWLRSREALIASGAQTSNHDSINSIVPQNQKNVNVAQPNNSNGEKKLAARHRAGNADPLHTSTSVSTLTPDGGLTSSKESGRGLQSRGLQLPKEGIRQHDSDTSIAQQEQKNVKEKEKPGRDTKFSLSSPIGDSAFDKLKKNLGLKASSPNVTVKPHDIGTSIGVASRWFNSVSILAKDHPKIKPFLHIAARARQKQEDLRQHFKHRADKWTAMLKRGSNYIENKAAWIDLLWKGDVLEKEFTTEELRAAGYNDDVIRAYRMVRAAIKHAYKLANDVRQEARIFNERMSRADLEALKKKPFREILSENQIGQDEYLVSYRAPKIREHEGTLSKAELDTLKADSNVHIISEKPLKVTAHVIPEASGLVHGDGFFNVKWEEQKPPIGNRTGYMPHFFHEWFIMEKQTSDTGEVTQRMLGSGKTMSEAVKKANEIAKGLVKGEIVVQPKQFQFPGAAEQAALVGDMDYFKMVQKVADDLSINLQDANDFLSEKVHMKNRHRFVGNFMKRTGAKGFEKDLDWVLSHYFNMIGRYVALDPFKHEAISRFNRLYGNYDGRHEGEAAYVRNYIDDVLGIPTQIEKDLNSWIEKHPSLRAFLGNYLGDRPSLQLAGSLTGLASAMKLNFLNVASTMLQLTQFINVAAAINSYEYASKGVASALKPSPRDKMILHRSGIQSSLGLDNAAGYSKTGVSRWVQFSTISFRLADGLIRKAAVLGAYSQAIDQGKSRGEALQYAKEINQKANFEYAVDNAPDIFRRGGPASQVLLQFKKFPIMQIEYMGDMFKNGSTEQKLKFFVPYFLMSGIWGIPFVDLFGTALGALIGVDWEEKLKKVSFEWAGDDKFWQSVVKGVWYSAVPGVDVSSRVGIGEFGTMRVPKTVLEGFASMFGVTGDTTYNFFRQSFQGNGIEAIKAITPGVGNILQAVAGETKGKRGRTQTRYEETMSRIIKALGFMPIEESVDRDRNWIINAEKQGLRDEVSSAIDDYLRAEANKDTEEKREAMKELRRLKVSPQQVANERKRKRQTNTERTESLIPKKYRSEFQQLQQFE